jgi:acyl-CoA thioesterase I
MKLITYLLVSGEALFLGTGMIMAAYFLNFLPQKKWIKILILFLAIFGFFLAFVSTTPISNWIYLIWVACIFLWLAIRKFSRVTGLLVLAITLAVFLMELPYCLKPDLPKDKFDVLYIIGDSISSGIKREKQTWPEIISQEHQVKVINLAQAGATVKLALRQVEKIKFSHALVLLEIGGNDLFRFTPPSEYEKDLSDLLKAVSSPSRTLVMFELPLFPSRQAFGEIQRRLAEEYKVILIPKRFFAGVLLTPQGTLDGIHLSNSGHQEMAQVVWEMIRQVMVKQKLDPEGKLISSGKTDQHGYLPNSLPARKRATMFSAGTSG